MTSRERYEQLLAKIDAFGARVAERYPGEMACARGCGSCCQAGLSVTGIEAAVLREGLAQLDSRKRAALAERAVCASASCPVLESDGTCALYEHRPLVCRTQGLPIRLREPGSPEQLVACELCFEGRDLGEIDPECVLDQATLSTILAALDRLHASVAGEAPGGRVAIAALLAEAADAR
jgi:Fe-S-cluster containining protein